MLDCIANDKGSGWMIINRQTMATISTGETGKAAWMSAADNLQKRLDDIGDIVSPHPSGEGE